MNTKTTHEHDYKKGRGNVDVCACGKFRFNEKAGEPIVGIDNKDAEIK